MGVDASEDGHERVTVAREERGNVLSEGLENLDRMELFLLRRERELWERERDRFGRGREIRDQPSPAVSTETSMGGIKGIKELLPNFEATDNTFWRWKSQLELLRETYRLDENATRILIGSCLKGRALSWFYSKTEHLTLSIEDLLKEMQQMFDLRPGKLALRKKFEARVWKGDEPFCNYYHEKMILANRVPVAEDELLDYLIEGIINVNLRNQVRFAKFKSRAELLEAFESVSLERGDRRTELGGAAAAEWSRGGVGAVGGGASSTGVRQAEDRTGGAETVARDGEVRQVRCYQCGELGHIASRCGRRACYACGLPGHQAVAPDGVVRRPRRRRGRRRSLS